MDLQPATLLFEDSGAIPNNPKLPLLYYEGAFEDVTPELIEQTFAANDWGDSWRASVFPFPHYHAEAHEALGCFRGTATIRLGGAGGIEQRVQPGDVVVFFSHIPHQGAKLKQEDENAPLRCNVVLHYQQTPMFPGISFVSSPLPAIEALGYEGTFPFAGG